MNIDEKYFTPATEIQIWPKTTALTYLTVHLP